MEVKLIKNTAGEYYLIVLHKNLPRWFNVAVSLELSDGYYAIASSHHINGVEGLHKLSLTNCQAIERGYDLDELFNEVDESIDYHEFDFTSFRLGFQKALEILGDKKFSDVNMEDAYYFGSRKLRGEYLDFIKTFQQTEWDVVIEMEEPLTAKSRQIHGDFVAGKLLESSVFPNPKLDSEGCLILKRK